jgi:signal peptidase I
MAIRIRRSLLTVFFAVAACLLAGSVLGPTLGFIGARVEGRAMAPTLADQDRLIVNTWSYRRASPQRGDIVMLRYPRDRSKSFVKRVIAAGGDVVRIEDGRVLVNDVSLDEPYVDAAARSHDTRAPQTIPAGYYYVLGDRRNNSSDSREWGLVPNADIVGRVAWRWWPSFERF